jgi:acyl-CoA thioester hydrolase
MLDQTGSAIPTPFVAEGITVKPEWIDYNGHMNVAYYVIAFDAALDGCFTALGLGMSSLDEGRSVFTAEKHLTYQRELREGDGLRITSQLLGFDAKRVHIFQTMYHADEGYLAATDEWMFLYIDMTDRRTTPMPDHILQRLARVSAAHEMLPRPPQVGRGIGLANRRPG